MLQDWLGTVSVLDLAASMLWIVGLIGAMMMLRSWLRPWLTKAKEMLTDWGGVTDREGVRGRPGVMMQLEDHGVELAKQSAQLDEHTLRLATVERLAGDSAYNSKANGGGSAYDGLLRTVVARFDGLDARLNVQETKLDFLKND